MAITCVHLILLVNSLTKFWYFIWYQFIVYYCEISLKKSFVPNLEGLLAFEMRVRGEYGANRERDQNCPDT